jgi:hypothetical protein
VFVYSDRGGSATGEVRSGEATELVLEIPPCPDRKLLVVDSAKRPIAGAEVRLVSNEGG